MTSDEMETKARHFLDNWKFWMVVAYLGLVLVFILLFVVFSRQADATAFRRASIASENSTKVSQCDQRVQSGPAVISIIGSIKLVVDNSITVTRAAINTQPDNTLTPSRKASLARLEPASADLQTFIEDTRKSTPTQKKCDALAISLGVKRVSPAATKNRKP